MSKNAEINSWDAYMKAHLQGIPKGKENEYVAAVMVGYKNKNQNPPVPYSRKKAEKDTASLMMSPMFQEQMKNNQAEMLDMMAKGKYDEMVKKTVSPVPVYENNIGPAYKGLEEIQKKMAEGGYPVTPTKEWNALQNQVNKSVTEYKADPQMSEAMKIVNLLKVYTSFKDYEASVPRNSRDHAQMDRIGLEILTALGGGPEAVSKRLGEHFAEAERDMKKIEDEVNGSLPEHLRPNKPEEGPILG